MAITPYGQGAAGTAPVVRTGGIKPFNYGPEDEERRRKAERDAENARLAEESRKANSVAGVAKNTFKDIGSRFKSAGIAAKTALTEAPAPKSLDMQGALSKGWEALHHTVVDTQKRFEELPKLLKPMNRGQAVRTAVEFATGPNKIGTAAKVIRPQVGAVETATISGRAALGVVNTAFLGVTVPLEAMRGIPGAGYVADGIHNVFGALGAGGGALAAEAVDGLPFSQENKEKIRPLVEEIGALTAMYLGPKVGGKVHEKTTAKIVKNSQEILKVAEQEIIGARTVLENRIVKVGEVQPSLEATNVKINTPTTRHRDYAQKQGYEPYTPNEKLPTIDAGETPRAPKDGMPTIEARYLEPAFPQNGYKYEPIKAEAPPPIENPAAQKPVNTPPAERVASPAPETIRVEEAADSPVPAVREVEIVPELPQGYSPAKVIVEKLQEQGFTPEEANFALLDSTPVERVGVRMYDASEVVSKLPAKTRTETVEATEGSRVPEAKTTAKTDDSFKSRVWERMQEENPNMFDGDLLVERKKMDEQTELAANLLEKDREKAYRIAKGIETSDKLTQTAANVVMAEMAIRDGNFTLAADLVRTRSLANTRRGQEISMENLSINETTAAGFVQALIGARMNLVGKLSASERVGDFVAKVRKRSYTSPKGKALQAIEAEKGKMETGVKNKDLDLKEAQSLIDKLTCK
jgi:hypothetical protein